MALYNGERFLQEQLDSFVAQTRLPDELVVSDDASTDRSVEIVREFAASAPFAVKLIEGTHNVGVRSNFERAIRACSGDIIFLADWDDVQYPDKLLVMERAFEDSPRAGVVLCNADLVDEKLQPLALTLWEAQGFRSRGRMRQSMAEGLAFHSGLSTNGCCTAFRSELKPLIVPAPEGVPFVEYDAFIVWTICLSGAGGVALLPQPLLAYRQYRGQWSGAGGKKDSIFGLLWTRLSRRSQRPPFGPLIERLETPLAVRLSRNQEVRESVLRHWRARWGLPASRLARIPRVLGELTAGRYHRFSGGTGAAVKDLFFVE